MLVRITHLFSFMLNFHEDMAITTNAPNRENESFHSESKSNQDFLSEYSNTNYYLPGPLDLSQNRCGQTMYIAKSNKTLFSVNESIVMTWSTLKTKHY